MWNLFKRHSKKVNQSRDSQSQDMRDTPVDNPLDQREDGSIRKGDPAYNFMMEVFESGKPAIATQKSNGTWETETLNNENRN